MDERYYYLYLDAAPCAADVLSTLAAAQRRGEEWLQASPTLRQVRVATGASDDRRHVPLCSLARGGEWQDEGDAPGVLSLGPRSRLSPLAKRAA